MKLSRIWLSVFILLITGCAENIPFPETIVETRPVSYEPDNSPIFDSFIRENLMAQYVEWKGTPYQYQGLSNKGVDCSGFMYITFKSQFGIEMPRSTKEQSQLGINIEKTELRSGDLVFFKTGFRTRHVGVYLGDSNFLHASTKRGVMISNLNSEYWKSSYWMSKRVLK